MRCAKVNNDPSVSLYCLPLERAGGHYVLAREWLASNLEPIPEVKLRQALKDKFELESAIVLISGALCQTKIYTPKDNEDFCYVVVDSDQKPIDSEASTISIHQSLLQNYSERVVKEFGYSEGILPEQRSYLRTEYLDRTCEVQSPSGSRKLADWRAVTKGSRVLLVGRAGAGKTTLLRRITIGLVTDDSSSTDYQLPVYIQLRNWHEGRGIERLVQHELAEFAADDFSSKYAELANSGRLLFLLDGFDEIAMERRTEALDDLKRFMRKNLTCRFVISTRPSVIPNTSELNFIEFLLNDLSASQVQELCWRKLPEREASWKSFWNRLVSEPDVASLSANPLVLTLLIARFIRDSLSPHFVGEVLSATIEALTDEWDSVRGVRRNIVKTLTPKLQLALLRHLAAAVSSRGLTEFTDSDYSEIMDGMVLNESPRLVIQKLEEHTGLVHRTSKNTWRFSHRAVQDYLCSAHLSDKSASILETDPRTSEMVWRYACWNASDASDLLRRKSEGPYRSDYVMSATKALTQNLFVHTDVVRAYSLSAVWLLEKLCAGLEVSNLSVGKGGDIHRRISCRLSGTAERAADLKQLRELLIALHHARDGVANRELSQRIESSNDETVRLLAPFVRVEGRLEGDIQTTDAVAHLIIKSDA